MTIKTAADAVPATLTKLRESPIQCEWLEGDHELLPKTPIACVFPAATSRDYVGQPRRVQSDVVLVIMVYHGAVQATGVNQQENIQLVDQIVNLLEADASFGEENVIDALVTRVDYGEAVKGRSKYYASRIMFQLRSRFNIGV